MGNGRAIRALSCIRAHDNLAGIAACVATHYLLDKLQPTNKTGKDTKGKVRKILKKRREKLRKFLRDAPERPVC